MSDEQDRPLRFPGERPLKSHHRFGEKYNNGDKPVAVPAIVPADDEIEQHALRFSTLAGNLKKERDQMREKADNYQARLEQSEVANSELRTQLEIERARTAEAKEEAEHARAEQVRLETVLNGMLNQARDALDVDRAG